MSVQNSNSQYSCPKSKRGFGVAASPFNAVKLELGVILVLALCVWLAAEFITSNEFMQVLILLCYSLLGTVWLVLRTKYLLAAQMQKQTEQSVDSNEA